MKAYLDVLQKILDEGVEKESGRANMPNTISISKADIGMNLSDGFPLLTTKKMYFKGIVHEILWFLRGETNIKYLVDNKVNIWNGDAYRWYQKQCDDRNYRKFAISMEMFLTNVKRGEKINFNDGTTYSYGDLGKVYGHQWRNQNGVDQIKDVVDGLKSNPYSRYHIIDGWNKADFPEMALPPCHLLYQFIVRPLTFDERHNIYRERNNGMMLNFDSVTRITNAFNEMGIPKFYLDLNMYQRSVDTALGAPFNIASMSLLLSIIAKASNMVDGIANWIGGDTHIYLNQLEGVKEQLKREPKELPILNISKEINSLDDICGLTINDFELLNYESHPRIKFELSVGLKK